MADPLAKLLVRYRKRIRRDVEQVREGVYLGPSGDAAGARGKVRLGRCETEIEASRSSNHLKGSTVLVASTYAGQSAVFPAPPGKQGPAFVAAKEIKGAPIEPIQGQFAKFLILHGAGAGADYEAYTTEGGECIAFIGNASEGVGLGSSILPDPSENLGPGTRISYADQNTVDASLEIVTEDLIGPDPDFTAGATYRYTPPVPWVATSPQQVGMFYYWIEHQLTGLGEETTLVRLRRSTSAKWTPAGISTIGSPFVVQSTIFAGPNVEWFSAARGPDYTDNAGGLWLPVNVEDTRVFERVRVTLSTGDWDQKNLAESEGGLATVPWAGLPLSTILCVTRGTTDFPADEDSTYPLFAWDGDEEDVPTDWLAPSVSAIDVAPDPDLGIGIWILTDTPEIIHLDGSGNVLETISVETEEATGLAVLEGDGVFIEDIPEE